MLGRLAVDHRHRGRRLGEHMLLDACARALRSDIATFAVVVDAKDDRAAAFYRAYDFVPLDAGGRRPFSPMTTIALLFA
ncbi:GNAT family N-acetyltransferase [Methylobacterium sp. CB376]|uniref:GNAT family N-acetyltransferase n=2 Tax=Methylobacterium TaxID=407 RepID=UPI00223E9CCB|nr:MULTISPECIES: GNAT family N-acetyltransferase [Methylobacterium]WFT81222.1 GNAT family N-acetyltransferase [Methylobacterium nodulans]